MTDTLDEIDHRLLALLEADARLSGQELADALGISTPTVRKRIQRLQDDGIMELVAVADVKAAGFDYVLVIGIQVQGRSALAVAEAVATFEDVIGVNLVVGEFDIEAIIIAQDQHQVSELLSASISAIPGVSRISPSLSLDVVKFQPNWVPFQ